MATLASDLESAIRTIPDFKESLPLIRSAVDECKKHGDTWTLRRLLVLFNPAVTALNEEAAAALGRGPNEGELERT